MTPSGLERARQVASICITKSISSRWLIQSAMDLRVAKFALMNATLRQQDLRVQLFEFQEKGFEFIYSSPARLHVQQMSSMLRRRGEMKKRTQLSSHLLAFVVCHLLVFSCFVGRVNAI
jgi:hypothetical protein